MCLLINMSGYSSVSSSLFFLLHSLPTDYLLRVFLQWIILCMETVCTIACPLNFEQSPPHPKPQPSLCSVTAEQNVAGGSLSGRARGDLATSYAELVLVGNTVPDPRNVLQLCRQAWWTEGRPQPHTHAQPHGSRCHMAAPEPSAGEEM